MHEECINNYVLLLTACNTTIPLMITKLLHTVPSLEQKTRDKNMNKITMYFYNLVFKPNLKMYILNLFVHSP